MKEREGFSNVKSHLLFPQTLPIQSNCEFMIYAFTSKSLGNLETKKGYKYLSVSIPF